MRDRLSATLEKQKTNLPIKNEAPRPIKKEAPSLLLNGNCRMAAIEETSRSERKRARRHRSWRDTVHHYALNISMAGFALMLLGALFMGFNTPGIVQVDGNGAVVGQIAAAQMPPHPVGYIFCGLGVALFFAPLWISRHNKKRRRRSRV